jgi:hypothetical protein
VIINLPNKTRKKLVQKAALAMAAFTTLQGEKCTELEYERK